MAHTGCTEEAYNALLAAFDNNDVKAKALCEQLGSPMEELATGAEELAMGLNTLFLLYGGALVFFMHAGFAMLCAGAVRSKNTMNILLMTVLDAACSAIAFYLVGYGFAYGQAEKPNGFIGSALYGLKDWSTSTTNSGGTGMWTDWLFQWAFAATATTIPAGCVAERFNFNAYLVYSVFISAFVYPVVAHWLWSADGWLCFYTAERLFGSGMIDFAGSGVVHMVGAFSGLVGCIMVGPRLGRFDSNGRPVDLPGHSATLVVLGTLFLWFGWYGFNPGSTLLLDSAGFAYTSGRAAVTTTLSGASACITSLLITFFKHRAWDLLQVCNGVLVGFVSITAGAHVVEPWAAMLAGAVGACIFDFACWGFLKLRIDDPLAAAPMHGVVGVWACLFVGLLAKQEYVTQAYGMSEPSEHYGAFYGAKGNLFAAQLVGVLSIIAWVLTLMTPLFYALKRLGLLRISPEEEHAGLDISKHGGSAYNGDLTGAGALGASKPERVPVSLTRE